MLVAEHLQLPNGQQGGRAQRAAPPLAAWRLTPANDNRSPQNPRIKWLSLALLAAVAVVTALNYR